MTLTIYNMLYVTGRDDLDELAQQVNGCGAPKGFS
jgi:hypothetical protein